MRARRAVAKPFPFRSDPRPRGTAPYFAISVPRRMQSADASSSG